jgi:hypothetical protein
VTIALAFTAKADVELQIPDSTPVTPAAIEAAIRKSLEGGVPTEFDEIAKSTFDEIAKSTFDEIANRPSHLTCSNRVASRPQSIFGGRDLHSDRGSVHGTSSPVPDARMPKLRTSRLGLVL